MGRPVPEGFIGRHGLPEVVYRYVPPFQGCGGDGERVVRRPHACDREASGDGELGERDEQLIGLGCDVFVAEQPGGQDRTVNRDEPDAVVPQRRKVRTAQATQRARRCPPVARHRRGRGQRPQEGVVGLGQFGGRDELLQHRQELLTLPLEEPDRDEVGTVPAQDVRITSLPAQRRGLLGQLLGMLECTGTDRKHDVNRRDHVRHREVPMLGECGPQQRQGTVSVRMTG